MEPKKPGLSTVIVSLPGMLQNELVQLMARKTDVNLIGVASGGLSALNLIMRHDPVIVVINSNLPEMEAAALIQAIKETHGQTYSLTLVETTQQLQRATLAGSDLVIRSYNLSSNLDQVLKELRDRSNGVK